MATALPNLLQLDAAQKAAQTCLWESGSALQRSPRTQRTAVTADHRALAAAAAAAAVAVTAAAAVAAVASAAAAAAAVADAAATMAVAGEGWGVVMAGG